MIRLRDGMTLAIAAAIAACGGNNSTVRVAGNNSADPARVAAQANEPRTNDATAAQPGLNPMTAGPTVAVGAGPAPASSATKPHASEAADDAAAAPAGPVTDTAPKKISARHVLVQWMGSDRAGKSVLRTKEQAQVLAQEVLKRAKSGDDLGRLAVEYSDEPNAGARGGSLGRFGRGQMVGAFETTAFKLKVGEISDIVETPFGYHIIQRTE